MPLPGKDLISGFYCLIHPSATNEASPSQVLPVRPGGVPATERSPFHLSPRQFPLYLVAAAAVSDVFPLSRFHLV